MSLCPVNHPTSHSHPVLTLCFRHSFSRRQVVKLLSLVGPLVRDADDQEDEDEEDFADEQELVARLIHRFANADSPDVQFQIYVAARRVFGEGGDNRIPYTLVPLVMSALRLCVKSVALVVGLLLLLLLLCRWGDMGGGGLFLRARWPGGMWIANQNIERLLLRSDSIPRTSPPTTTTPHPRAHCL